MNMLRRSVGRAVRSRIVPYVALYAVLLALHLQFTLGTGDDPMYAAMLDQYSLAYFSLWHYYTWSARTLIEAVVCIVEALPAIVWRLADPLCITLCAACIVRLARLEDRPAGRWAVCGLALCYPWQDMSSAGWVCTTLVFVWPLLAALAALLPLGMIVTALVTGVGENIYTERFLWYAAGLALWLLGAATTHQNKGTEVTTDESPVCDTVSVQ